jgi:hypothetical protein
MHLKEIRAEFNQRLTALEQGSSLRRAHLEVYYALMGSTEKSKVAIKLRGLLKNVTTHVEVYEEALRLVKEVG